MDYHGVAGGSSGPTEGEIRSWIASQPEASAMELESALREGMKQVGAAQLLL